MCVAEQIAPESVYTQSLVSRVPCVAAVAVDDHVAAAALLLRCRCCVGCQTHFDRPSRVVGKFLPAVVRKDWNEANI